MFAFESESESDNQENFPPLLRNPSLHSLSDASSIWAFTERTPMPTTRTCSQTLYSQLIDALMENADDGEPYPCAVKRGNIILDMDGTLGDNIPRAFIENPKRYSKTIPIPRPGLRKFFRYVFAYYERVSIWTAALPEWYKQFKEEVLLPNMPPGAEFHFERTRVPSETYVVLKPLREIYAKYPEYNSTNTTIVDDNVETFKDNPENAVHIPSFFYDLLGYSPEVRKQNAAKDRGLFYMIEVLNARR